jgi:hypothetical protein
MQQKQPLRRSARIAAKAAASKKPNPPDVGETEVRLSIQIPIRRFPACNEEAKLQSVAVCRDLLNKIEATPDMNHRAYYATKLYEELVRQPLLVAYSNKFRTVAMAKAEELRGDLNKIPCMYTADDLQDALEEFNYLLYDIHLHPWYNLAA